MKNREHDMGQQSDELGKIQRRVCYWTITFAVVVAVFLVFLNERAIAKGLLLGACFSVVNFFLMGKTIPITLGHSRSKSTLIGLASIFSRYIVLAIPIILGIKLASINFVAVVIGIFGVQIVTLVDFIVIRPVLDGKS
jgi:hypothetical protein